MANVISVGDLLLSLGIAAAMLPLPAMPRRQPRLVGVME
jgi:hypothetical protein